MFITPMHLYHSCVTTVFVYNLYITTKKLFSLLYSYVTRIFSCIRNVTRMYLCGVTVTISFRSEKVTNLHITIIYFFLRMSWIYMPTNTYNCCHSYDNYKQNNRMEGTNPREIKGWVAKWQHAFGTPFLIS